MPIKEIDSGYLLEERRRLRLPVERFDRIAYARRVLDILRPDWLRVALYHGRFELRVERGRTFVDPDGGPASASGRGERGWAMIGIPPHATREEIAFALADLVGLARHPFAVDLLSRAS